MKSLSPVLKAHLAMFTVALLYGANYSIAKVVLDDGYIQPNGFILLRALVAGSILFLLHRIFVNEKIDKQDYGRLILCGIFGAGINMMFFFMGLKAVSYTHLTLPTICSV